MAAVHIGTSGCKPRNLSKPCGDASKQTNLMCLARRSLSRTIAAAAVFAVAMMGATMITSRS